MWRLGVLALATALAWGVMHGLPALLSATGGFELETGTYSFHRTPPGWEAGLADLERGAGLKCTRVSGPNGGALVLDCSLVRSRSSETVFGLLLDRFGLGAGITVADFRVSAAVTPFPWLNHTAFWWMPLPLLLVLLAGHAWREDLRACTWWLRRRPLVLVGWALALTVASRLRNMAHGHPFFSASPDLGWYVLAPVLLGPILEELLFRGVLYRWFQSAGFTTRSHAVLSSLLFVLWHYSELEPLRMIVLFVSGLVLFHVRHRSGSISLAIVVHALVNLTGHLL